MADRRIYFFMVIVTTLTTTFTADGSQPNILLIVSEDNGPEVGCYGDPYARTPNIDRLAEEGLLFRNAYVPQAGCSQSRASFLTGLYPHQHGQIGLATWGFRLYHDTTPNLPRILKKTGYRTGLIGKLHINPASAFPFDLHEISTANFQRNGLADYARHAKEFISAGDKPFFLSVNYPDAHDPWIRQVDGLPKKPQKRDDVTPMAFMGVDSPAFRDLAADYYNCMSRLDSLIGDLLQVLEDSGKGENTIVIYIGDHGADMLRSKRTCYEGGLRIPMIMRWRGQIKPHICNKLVSTLDIMPTVLDAAGAEKVDGLPGETLQPLFKGQPVSWREHFFAEYHTHAAAPNFFPQRCVRNRRYKLIESLLPDTVHPDYEKTIAKLQKDYDDQDYAGRFDIPAMIASAPHEVRKAYAIMRQPPRFQLYDLQDDPYEFKNLAEIPEYSTVLDDLKQRLTVWRRETHDPLLEPEKLERLKQEVQLVKKKSDGKKHTWLYPEYLVE
ncbi:MAG TPA: sulfatase [Planctomycetaceae bacterium]|nr:sulfatase [Planctomycetaceae bacterium]